MKRNQSGFTLIEIAIVLVIIGLLLGGILKGQELINSAKVKNLATDFRNVPVFIYSYQDKYKALPGDDSKVNTHVGGTAASTPTSSGGVACASSLCIGNGVIDGSWKPTATTDETAEFWAHLRLANIAPGSPTVAIGAGNTFIPTNAVGGDIGITNAYDSPIANMKGSYIVCSDGIAGKYARQLDTTLDDGVTNTGSLQVIAAGSTARAGAAVALTPTNDDTPYLVCMGF